jgi:hypothetical protein
MRPLQLPLRAALSHSRLGWLVVTSIVVLAATPTAAASPRYERVHAVQRRLGERAKLLPLKAAASERAPRKVVRHTFQSPLAVSASVNTVIPKFKFFLIYHTVNSRKLQLKGFEIKPFFRRSEDGPYGGCTACKGKGHFNRIKFRGNTLIETEKGKRFMTRKTRFPEAVVTPGEIGRFKEYGVKVVHGSAVPYVRAAGCLAADAPVSNDTFLVHQALPTVPCSQKLSKSDHVSFNSPLELAANRPETVSGTTTGTRWLSVFLSHSACARDALGEAPRAIAHGFWFVGGNFSETFTSTDTRVGNFCVYLQAGGRYKGVPDGRVTVSGAVPYLAGDSIHISGPTSTTPGGTTDDTFSGNASTAEEFYDFISNAPCASTAQSEYQQAIGYYEAPVQGAFSKTVNSVPFDQSGYVCAYLQIGAPSGTTPTGPTVVGAELPVSVQ